MGNTDAARMRTIPSLTGTPPHLDLAALPPDPVTLFSEWLDTALAADVAEPIAATLATVGHDGIPDTRTLLVKSVDAKGWTFAGTASSRKGRQLSDQPTAALNLWWQPLMRAVRVRGHVVEAPTKESAADLAARSPAARAGVAPGDWRLWRLQPSRVEFWQGAVDRQHLRIVYTATDPWDLTILRGESDVTDP